jgi:hypothetical protein
MSFNIEILFEGFPPNWIQLNATDSIRDIINFVGNRYGIPVENLMVLHYERLCDPDDIIGPMIGPNGLNNRFRVMEHARPIGAIQRSVAIGPPTDIGGLGLAGAVSRGGGGGRSLLSAGRVVSAEGRARAATVYQMLRAYHARQREPQSQPPLLQRVGGRGQQQGPPPVQRRDALLHPLYSVAAQGGRVQQQGGRGGGRVQQQGGRGGGRGSRVQQQGGRGGGRGGRGQQQGGRGGRVQQQGGRGGRVQQQGGRGGRVQQQAQREAELRNLFEFLPGRSYNRTPRREQ